MWFLCFLGVWVSFFLTFAGLDHFIKNVIYEDSSVTINYVTHLVNSCITAIVVMVCTYSLS